MFTRIEIRLMIGNMQILDSFDLRLIDARLRNIIRLILLGRILGLTEANVFTIEHAGRFAERSG